MFTINLNKLCFHSFHGIHAEEKILGNEYEVNVAVSFDAAEKIILIGQTLNYASLYDTIRNRMNMPTPLLETVAEELVDEIRQLDDRIRKIMITIEKKYPPLATIQGSVSVCCVKEY